MFTTTTLFTAICTRLVPVIMPDAVHLDFFAMLSCTAYDPLGAELEISARDGAYRVVAVCNVCWEDFDLEIDNSSSDCFCMFVNLGIRQSTTAEEFASLDELVERVREIVAI